MEAQEFLLKDADGRVRARLGLYPNGKEVKVGWEGVHCGPEKVMPGQAALQFFDERGEEVWVTPKDSDRGAVEVGLVEIAAIV